MATLFFYRYNNYYNRQIKKEENISDYGEAVYIETGGNLNFNPNDGVNTEYVAGRAGNPYGGKADYVIYSEDNANITSRWFIIEQTRTLKNQYKCKLRRDVLVDYYNQISSADTFIEKAILPDSSSLVYNDEGITTNQIKTSELELRDDTGCPWVVGYIDRKYNRGAETPETLKIESNVVVDEVYNSLTDYPYYNYTNKPCYWGTEEEVFIYARATSLIDHKDLRFRCIYKATDPTSQSFRYNESGYQTGNFVINMNASGYNLVNGSDAYAKKLTQNFPWDSYRNNHNIYITKLSESTKYKKILKEDGKIIQAGGNIYKVSLEINNNFIESYEITPSPYLYTAINNACKAEGFSTSGDVSTSIFCTYKTVKIILTEVGIDAYTAIIQKTRYTLRDAPYDMFAIPAGLTISVGDTTLTIDKELAVTFGQGIAQSLGATCYDVQLVPYCPFTGYSMSNGNMIIQETSESRYTYINGKDNVKKGIMIWCLASSFNKKIEHTIDIKNRKIENQCDMWRLVSPNYNGQFEFNVAKNNGLDFFTVNATYLPYQPFIRVAPNFKNLYGNEYKDARGLICGGNFSITQISDTFTNYVNSNKNYNDVFQREIQNMDTNHKYQRIQSITGAASGAVGTGLIAGGVTNPIGGIVAGAMSAAGGIADLTINEALYSEALDYKKDMFGYQLDNIKAMPNSISRTTAYNEINKTFPILEYYTCTEEEKAAVANKIAWNGMTVMTIGHIGEYISNSWKYGEIKSRGYIKGRLIRIENVSDDFHLVNAIADEVYKGAYYDTGTN